MARGRLALYVEASLPRVVHPRRSRNVATWIWCHLTSGDYRRSPAFRDGFSTYDQNSYSIFRRDVVPRLLTHMRPRAERVLSERGLSSSAESWRQSVSRIAGAESGVLAAAG